MRIKTREILNYREVLGMLMCDDMEEYKDLFEKMQYMSEDEVEEYLMYYISEGKVDFIEILPNEIAEFLGLDESKIWYVNIDSKNKIVY